MRGGNKSERLGLWGSYNLDLSNLFQWRQWSLPEQEPWGLLLFSVNLANRTKHRQVENVLTKWAACWYLCSHCAYNCCWCKVSEAHLESQDSRAGVAFQLLLAPEVNKEQQGFKVPWDLKVRDVTQHFFPPSHFTAINCPVVATSLDGEEGKGKKVSVFTAASEGTRNF